jgi:hypothetical protein
MSETTPNSASSVETVPNPVKEKLLPFSRSAPMLFGALLGIVMRFFVFKGTSASGWSPMLGAFIYGAPIVVGALTIYLAERIKQRSLAYWFGASFLANVFFILGTLLIMIEGMICAIVIVPMFACLGAVGGVLMGAVCRLTKWSNQTLASFIALPLLLAGFEKDLPLPVETPYIERTIHINAKPEHVWTIINHVENIKGEEVGNAWAYRIGAPLPVSGITIETPQGKVRQMKWEKGVYFDGMIMDWHPNKFVHWSYKFYPDSFPPGALDDHVVIGGKYFDLLDSSYELIPSSEGTYLKLRAHYRISTQFNLYSGWVAQFLIGNFEDTMLQAFKTRSEAASHTPSKIPNLVHLPS